MMHALRRSLAALALVTLGSVLTFGQVTATGSLSGAVTDPSGAAIAGATVAVKNNATNEELTTTTSDEGTFTVPSLTAGFYTVTITPTMGFKQAVLTEVKINAGQPSNVNVRLEVGQVTESVTIVGAGGELINQTNATVNTTITGRQITELPFTSRDALDLVLLLPGTQTPGRPRTSTVNGLPKGALNITMDGLNVQDNLLKSSDGFFTYIRPRVDAIDEVSLSTATPGAESSGEGAVQIRFVTRGGTNDYRGSLYWYHRNPSLNANYFFNNQLLPPDPVDKTAPRNRVLLNQYGARVGGPISIPGLFSGRDRAFFFVNYEEFRLPERTLRQRTIFNPTTASGVFQYRTAAGELRTVPLLTLAAGAGLPNTVDPTLAALFNQSRSAVTGAGGGIEQLADPNFQRASFINPGGQDRYFPTVRFDFNVTDKHHVENIWNYQDFNSVVDFLNNSDPAFPGFPNFGSQASNRFSNVTAWRYTITPSLVNEARFGLTGGTILFFPEVGPGQFQNQGGFSLGTIPAGTGVAVAGISPFSTQITPQRRNTPVKQFNDNLTWIKGTHNLAFGGSFTRVSMFSTFFSPIVPTISFGFAPNDPALALFTPANFPGASAAQITQAQNIYAVLTGRVSSIGANAYRNEQTGNYEYLGQFVQRAHQHETGMYAQDTWRIRPNLTLTFGLRNEIQFPFVTENINFTAPTQGFAGVFGISGGPENLFRPGATGGTPTTFSQFAVGDKAYNTDYLNLAPSVGIAWSPDWKGGLLGRLAGSGGQTVLRGGFSRAFNREGLNVLLSILGSNPGGSLPAPRNFALGNLAAGTLFRNRADLGAPAVPSAPTFPLVSRPQDFFSVNAFDPNLKLGYVDSWTVGVQRELTKDMVFEARYVATRARDLQRQLNYNEINLLENGFVNEFRLAQQNLAANIAAGRGNTFRYFGPGTGTSPLPTIFGYFQGRPAADATNQALYTSAFFANTTFVNSLAINAPNPFTFAGNILLNPQIFGATAASAGIPRNFFVVNPDTLGGLTLGTQQGGGAFVVNNTGRTWYDGVTLELRRRMAQGLLVQGSYTFAKSLTNMFASSSVLFYQPATLRDGPDFNLDRVRSPFDIRHSFKVNWIYELPVGRGQMLLGDAGRWTNGILGGWAVHGTARIQSGTPFSFGNVQLVGMTLAELQQAVDIRKNPDKTVTYLPDDIILNTRRAFNATLTGYSALGAPEGRYIAPASNANCVQAYVGQCGFRNLVLEGPRFIRLDMSLVKRIRFTENTNFELRGEFLNALNNINFIVGNAANDVNAVGNFSSAVFGQTTAAYQDLSTTNDPGGRLVQIVLRLNF